MNMEKRITTLKKRIKDLEIKSYESLQGWNLYIAVSSAMQIEREIMRLRLKLKKLETR